jgi:toxin ParE1/3/4
MPRAEFDPDALADLDAIYDYIGRASRSADRADQVVDRIHQACELVCHPARHGRTEAGSRPGLRIFAVSPHVVIYRPLDDGIRVLRIYDGRRDYPALFRKGL